MGEPVPAGGGGQPRRRPHPEALEGRQPPTEPGGRHYSATGTVLLNQLDQVQVQCY